MSISNLFARFKPYSWVFPLLVYHAIFAIVVLVNFPSGKFFIGWDALNPEFNFLLNFKRAIFGSWQENYGLGVLGGHGFAATLPHTFIIYILSFVLPLEALRPAFTFLCLYVGGLGMYFLSMFLLSEIGKTVQVPSLNKYIPFIALIASLFYCFNLGTIQIFYVQLEAFIIHFAMLPWLFLTTIKLLEKRTIGTVIFFTAINIVATGQGFIPSLFVSYMTALGIFLGAYVLLHRASLLSIKNALFVFIVTLFINAYWLLPFGYYTLTHNSTYLNAYNNLISTPDFIDKNRKYGDLANVSLLKGFFFESYELGGYVLQPWVNHYKNPAVGIIGYGFFAIIVVGLLVSVVKTKQWIIKGFGFIFLYFFTSLATQIPPFSFVTTFLQFISPTFRQAFRTTFTKFSLGMAFSYSLFLGIGLWFLVWFIYRYFHTRARMIVITFIILGILLIEQIYAAPVFQDNLLYKKLKVSIPQQYFDVMNFFKHQESGRIAYFPMDCPEGWYAYPWGYFGSGFLGYGISQPILSQSYNVWGRYNENYYWEMVQAAREQDYLKIHTLFEKYNIRWVLYDPNIVHCRNEKGFEHFNGVIDYFNRSPNYSVEKTFISANAQPITLYRNNSVDSQAYVEVYQNLFNIGPIYEWTHNDQAFHTYGHYRSDRSKSFDIYYPFRSLFSGRDTKNNDVTISETKQSILFKTTIPKENSDFILTIPSVTNTDLATPAGSLEDRNSYPTIDIDGNSIQTTYDKETKLIIPHHNQDYRLEVNVPKLSSAYSFDNGNAFDNSSQLLKPCDKSSKGTNEALEVMLGNKRYLRLMSKNSKYCLTYDLGELPNNFNYLISIEGKNQKGRDLLVSVIDSQEHTVLERYISHGDNPIYHFVLSASGASNKGYKLQFSNISVGSLQTVNDIGHVMVYPIPLTYLLSFQLLSNLALTQDQNLTGQTVDGVSVSHPNETLYTVSVPSGSISSSSTLYLTQFQSFDEGWKAYQIGCRLSVVGCKLESIFPFVFGRELKEHVLINNWANGWQIEAQNSKLKTQNYSSKLKTNQSIQVVIIYLPQYLEYIGFLFMFGLVGYFIYLGRRV